MSKLNKIIGYHYTNLESYEQMQPAGEEEIGIRKYISSGLIPRNGFITLSSAEGLPKQAYKGVIEGLLEPEPESLKEVLKKYYDSRVPVFDYNDNYSVPQLTIWSAIGFERLKVEWVKPVNEVWNRVLRNNW